MRGLLVGAVLIVALPQTATAQYTFDWLGRFDSGSETPESRALAVSDDGQTVVGYSLKSLPDGRHARRAARWRAGEMLDLDVGGGDQPAHQAADVSADGTVIVGTTFESGTFPSTAFRWSDGVVEWLEPIPGHEHSRALGVSAGGRVVVGFSRQDSGGSVNYPVAWKDSMLIDLGFESLRPGWASCASEDGNWIAGIDTRFAQSRGGLWDISGRAYDLDLVGDITDISRDGSVLLARRIELSGLNTVVLVRDGSVIDIGPIGEASGPTVPDEYAMTGDGRTVYGSLSRSGTSIWDADHGLRKTWCWAQRRQFSDEVIDAVWGNGGIMDVSADGRVLVGYGAKRGEPGLQAWRLDLGSPRCFTDFNGDGKLNVNDFIAFQAAFRRGEWACDFNEDCSLNVNDFIAFQREFRKGCP